MWSYIRLGEDVVVDGVIVVDVVGVNGGGSGEHGATGGNGCVVVVVSCEGLGGPRHHHSMEGHPCLDRPPLQLAAR